MKLALSSLKKWVDSPLNISQLAEQLTMAGLETSVISSDCTPFNNIVVGIITEVSQHPNADRLNVCQVDCGPSHPLKTIVCGAENVRKGLKVAAALVGAKLPNGLVIQSRLLRGVTSEGMLCSVTELGLEAVFPQEANETGIWELSEDFQVGIELWEQLGLEEPLMDVQIPPNRGDCLSIVGIAREIAILNGLPFTPWVVQNRESTQKDTLTVEVEHPEACPRYTGRVIRDINPHAKTPWWMLKRLWQGGVKSINAIVDVTNYALLEWGAPLHAFDMDRLSGPLKVRSAQPGEKLHLLNDKSLEIQEEILVIADQKGPVALAGIMGGLESAVTEKTRHIFLESAYFAPEHIASRARQYGLMTESSYRFERGVDPELSQKALKEATYLLLTICGGQAGPVTQVESSKTLPATQTITLKHSAIKKILGIELSQAVVTERLERLGMQAITLSQQGDASENNLDTVWQMQCPSWRFDLKEAADLIEELARLSGYDEIPSELPKLSIRFQSASQEEESIAKWRHFLAAQGFYEAINYSFISERHQKALDPKMQPVVLENPISSELGVLRTQLWPGLLTTLQNNYSHQDKSHRFFECGTVFIQEENKITEHTHLAGVITGNLLPEQWAAPERKVDFFDLKQIVASSLQLLDPLGHYTYEMGEHPALHPSQSCQLVREGQPIGWLGALHPRLYEHFELSGPIYLFELQLSPTLQRYRPSFEAFSRLPAMRRDIAFWIDQKVAFSSIESAIIKSAGTYLKDIKLFDVYAEENNAAERSLALGLIWQHPERTLTDAEVDTWQTQVIKTLEKTWDIKWRSGA